MLFSDYLQKIKTPGELALLLRALTDAAVSISKTIETANVGKSGTKNVYGEEQIALDVLSEQIIEQRLKASGVVRAFASEELEKEQKFPTGKYAVAFDPLDGSSLVDVNLSVGTIFGIYEKSSLLGVHGREQIVAGYFLYGPRTTLVIALQQGVGVHEFTLDKKKQHFTRTRENLKLHDDGKKMFAPGNLRATSTEAWYIRLMEYWMKEQYTLRYSGGFVPDINQILCKGCGVFTYPGMKDAPRGKLRLLFECAPIAFLVTRAGGMATDGKIPILDQKAEDITQRTPIFIGASHEVKKVLEYLPS